MELKDSFKVSFKSRDGLEKRQKVTIELRKKNREYMLQKKRYKMISPNDEDISLNVQKVYDSLVNLNLHDNDTVTIALKCLRKMVSSPENGNNYQVYIDIGFLPILLQTIESKNDNIKFETIWTITNLCGGDSDIVNAVIECGLLPPLIENLQSSNIEIVEQTVWALSNIAGDNDDCKLLLIKAGIIDTIVEICSPESSTKFIENVAWFCFNLNSKGVKYELGESVYLETFIPLLAFLNDVILNFSESNDVILFSCYCVNTFTSINPNFLESFMDHEILSTLKNLFPNMENHSQLSLCIKIFGAFTESSKHELTDFIICNKIISKLYELLSHKHAQIRKEVCWMLSNIAGGTEKQFEMLIQSDFVPALVNLLENDQDHVQTEIIWIFSNGLINCSDVKIIELCVEEGIIPALMKYLSTCQNSTVIMQCLATIDSLLKMDRHYENSFSSSPYVDLVEECGGIEVLERCGRFDHVEIQKVSEDIISNFFDSDTTNEPMFDNDDDGTSSDEKNCGNYFNTEYRPEMEFSF